MTTVKFRSPFLLLLVVALLFSCKNSEHAEKQDQNKEHINSLIDESNQKNKPLEIRLQSSNSAYKLAQHTDKYFLWKAFNAKYSLLQENMPDSALIFLDKYTEKSLHKKDTLNLANAFFQKGKYYASQNKPDSAFAYYNASKQQYELLKDSLQTVEKLIYMADIDWNFNDYNGVESIGTEALGYLNPKLKTPTDTIYAAIVYNHCGLAYTGLSNYESALEIYEKASKLAKDSLHLKTIENNKAWVYMESGQYDKAIPVLSKLIGSKAILKDTIIASKIYDNYGYSLFRTGNDSGLEWMKKSLALREAKNDSYGLIQAYIYLAEYYQGKDKQKANDYLQKAYAIATANQSPDDRLFVLRHLRNFYSGNKHSKYSDIYIDLNDSINKVRQKAKNQFAKIRYDSKKEREDNLRLKAQQAEKTLIIERQENRNLILLIGIVLAFVVIVAITIFFRARIKIQKLNSVYETETRISEKLHDELANDAYHLMAFASSSDLSKADIKEFLLVGLDKLYAGVRNISRENGSIDTGHGFVPELKTMMSGYNNANTNVLFTGVDDLPWDNISKQKKIALYRTILELLVNMKKHSNCKRALFQFYVQDNKVAVAYSDDGDIAKEDINKKNGLQNVENRIEAIKGTVIFDQTSKKGFRISFSFPV